MHDNIKSNQEKAKITYLFSFSMKVSNAGAKFSMLSFTNLREVERFCEFFAKRDFSVFLTFFFTSTFNILKQFFAFLRVCTYFSAAKYSAKSGSISEDVCVCTYVFVLFNLVGLVTQTILTARRQCLSI